VFEGEGNEDYDYHNETAKKKKKPLKMIPRSISMVLLNLKGHLFDTQCFNKAIDACEKAAIQFRVVSWDVGN
jgi:hypothetical protein